MKEKIDIAKELKKVLYEEFDHPWPGHKHCFCQGEDKPCCSCKPGKKKKPNEKAN